MKQYRFGLEKYNGPHSRYTCPQCGMRNEFTRYINNYTGDYINEKVGRCNRENKCGYHYLPYQYFIDNNIDYPFSNFIKNIPQETEKTPSLITWDYLTKSISSPDEFSKVIHENNFIRFLFDFFQNEKIVKDLYDKYYLGILKNWTNEAIIFWQIDQRNVIRTGKVMLYDPLTGKRKNKVTWMHRILKIPNYNLVQCFFGEHLLRDKHKKQVVIVESEKTAIIASYFYPDYIWLAAGSVEGLNEEKCRVLQGRDVVLMPDLNAYEKWMKKAMQLSHITSFKVCNILERIAQPEEKYQGLDIADFLLKEIRRPYFLKIYEELRILFSL